MAYAGAIQAFLQADAAAEPGGLVAMYDACAGQAAMFCRAFAELTVALDRRRGKGQQRIVVERNPGLWPIQPVQAGRSPSQPIERAT
jgi:hypothetical protein